MRDDAQRRTLMWNGKIGVTGYNALIANLDNR